VLDLKLKTYDQAISRRRDIATRYQSKLGNVGQLTLPPPPGSDPRRFDIFQNYEIAAENRDGLRQYLADRGVGTILQWGGWMVHQFDDLGLRFHAPFAEEFSKTFMMLPLHHMLPNDDVDYVCECIQDFYVTAA